MKSKKQEHTKTARLHYAAAAVTAAMILLLSACGKKADDEQVSVQDPAEMQTVSEEKITEEETAAEDIIPLGEMPPWTLCETEDYTITLVDALDPDSGEARFLTTIVNNSDHYISVNLTDFLLNDVFRSTETASGRCDAHDVNSDEMYSFNKWLIQFEDDLGGLHKISFSLHVSVMDPATYQKLDSADLECTVVLPDDYETSMIFEPSFSMKAEEQVLFEDEERQIGIRGLGRSPDSTDLYAITGIIHVVNKSDHSIPVGCSGLRVNGFYIDPYSYGAGSLAAGSERYMLFLCQGEELELAGISEISSIELLILSSESENTGAYNAAGGSWYPVALSEAAEEFDDGSEDILIYEDEIVTVMFRDSWLEWHDVTYTDPYGYYHWILTVNNKSNKNIEFALADILINGIDEYERGFANGVWPQATDVGAGAKAVVHLKMRTDMDDPVPELSFRIQERTFGGGTLLHYAADPVVIEGREDKRLSE